MKLLNNLLSLHRVRDHVRSAGRRRQGRARRRNDARGDQRRQRPRTAPPRTSSRSGCCRGTFAFGFPIASVCKDIGARDRGMPGARRADVGRRRGAPALALANAQGGAANDMTSLVTYIEAWAEAEIRGKAGEAVNALRAELRDFYDDYAALRWTTSTSTPGASSPTTALPGGFAGELQGRLPLSTIACRGRLGARPRGGDPRDRGVRAAHVAPHGQRRARHGGAGEEIRAQANFAVFESLSDREPHLFMVGRYIDRLVRGRGARSCASASACSTTTACAPPSFPV